MRIIKQRSIHLLLGTMLAMSLCACSLTQEKNGQSDSPNNAGVTELATWVNENTLLSEVSNSSYKEDTAVKITADGEQFSSNGRGVVVSGNTVTINAEGCYLLSGIMNNGQVIVDADNGTDIRLVLDDFEIHNDAGAAIYVANAGTITVTLKEGTKNLLEQTGTNASGQEVQDAALYSTDDLIINGSGSLNILGNYCHGIKAKDTLLLTEATMEVTSKEDAVNANMDILLKSGTYKLSAGDDGVHTDTNFTVQGGTLEVTKSYEGLEGMQVWIEGGEISITANDDAVNIASNTTSATGFVLVVSGGKTKILAGGDGIDSNGSIYMTGGELEISGPTNNGNGSLDYAGSCTVQGGVFTMAGAAGMAQTPDNNSAQVGVMVYFNATVDKGTTVSLKDEDGHEVISMTPEVSYQCAYFSTPELKQGETYSLWQGDTKACDMVMNGTINNYSSDGTERQGGFGGFGGGMHQGGFDDGKGPGGRGQGGRKPEGMTPPEGMNPPEGMTPPDEL